MSEKLQFNNLILSKMNGIRRGRVQTINKLVNKIKKLKALLLVHPDQNRKGKLDKTVNILKFIKTLKRIDIAKKILLLNKDPKKILTNGLSPPEEAGIALLSSNKIISEIVNDIRAQLNIADNDLFWKDIITETSKRQHKHERTEKKKQKRMERKARNALKANFPDSTTQIKSEQIQSVSSSKREDENPDKFACVLEANTKEEENEVDSFFLPTVPLASSKQSLQLSDDIQPHIRSENENSKSPILKYESCISVKTRKVNQPQSVQMNTTKISGLTTSSDSQSTTSDLHPSWKAKQKSRPVILKFKGKKTKFED